MNPSYPTTPTPPMIPTKIIDCFTFFNELDLLEIRLNVLDPYVDHFVIVESNKTFQKQPKPFYFEENRWRFEKFLHKIAYVKQTEHSLEGTAFDMEKEQRNWISMGVASLRPSPDDIVLIGDLDEIPDPSRFIEIDATKRNRFCQKLYYYYLNCYDTHVGAPGCNNSTVAVPYSMAKEMIPHTLRCDHAIFDTNIIENGGWHFSYLGGVDKVVEKIKAFGHEELNTPYYTDRDRLSAAIDANIDIYDRPTVFQIVEIDESYPEYIRQNTDRYKHLIK